MPLVAVISAPYATRSTLIRTFQYRLGQPTLVGLRSLPSGCVLWRRTAAAAGGMRVTVRQACYYTASDVNACATVPAQCRALPPFASGGFSGDTSQCVCEGVACQ